MSSRVMSFLMYRQYNLQYLGIIYQLSAKNIHYPSNFQNNYLNSIDLDNSIPGNEIGTLGINKHQKGYG